MFLFELQVGQPASQKQKKSDLKGVVPAKADVAKMEELVKAANAVMSLSPDAPSYARAAVYLKEALKYAPQNRREEIYNQIIGIYEVSAARSRDANHERADAYGEKAVEGILELKQPKGFEIKFRGSVEEYTKSVEENERARRAEKETLLIEINNARSANEVIAILRSIIDPGIITYEDMGISSIGRRANSLRRAIVRRSKDFPESETRIKNELTDVCLRAGNKYDKLSEFYGYTELAVMAYLKAVKYAPTTQRKQEAKQRVVDAYVKRGDYWANSTHSDRSKTSLAVENYERALEYAPTPESKQKVYQKIVDAYLKTGDQWASVTWTNGIPNAVENYEMALKYAPTPESKQAVLKKIDALKTR